MSKTKVLYITRKYPPAVGGMENFSYHLYTHFDAAEVETSLISLGRSQKHLVWFLPYALVKTVCMAGRYDIIFVGDALLSSIGFFTKLFHKKKKVIVNVFGLDITFPNKLYQTYLKLFYNCFDKYISISRETDNTLRKRGVTNSVIITPGVDVSQFQGECAGFNELRKQYSIGEDETILLTVGRLVKRKGVNWFVRNVMPRLKGQPVRYLVVGGGEEHAAIAESIRELGLEQQVLLLGRVETALLNDIYLHADAFIMPNIHVEGDMEGFGLVAVEAALAGLPVIAAGIEGIRDAIKDGKNGWLLESGNAAQFYAKIQDIRQHPEESRKTAKAFQTYTAEVYSWNAICKQYTALFRRLLEGKDAQ